MKKFILSALLPLLYFLSLLGGIPLSASADSVVFGEYACVLSDSAYFYLDAQGGRGLFLLPQTYYVKVLEYGDEFCRVEYFYDDTYMQKLVGYAKTEYLTPVEYTPKRPYVNKQFEVSYRLDDSFSESQGFLDEIRLSCTYYGDYAVGSETYCYVLRGDEFGYVPKPASLSIERNTEYDEWLAARSEQTDASISTDTGSSPSQIAILIALCLLVPILAALILRPPRKPPYEE